jgi:UDP-galactopyranose mutase
MEVAHTRVHGHKHFAPWEKHEATVAFREFSKETSPEDAPYYPKRLAGDVTLLRQYAALAGQESGLSFLGRLATYRYLNMDQVIGEALDFARLFLESLKDQTRPPVFSANVA